MFIPAKFRQTDFAEIRRFLAAHPLATLVVRHDNRLQAAHVPLYWHDNGSEWGALRGHFAKANRVRGSLAMRRKTIFRQCARH